MENKFLNLGFLITLLEQIIFLALLKPHFFIFLLMSFIVYGRKYLKHICFSLLIILVIYLIFFIYNAAIFNDFFYAIKSVNIPTVEVHITDVKKRDDFRKKSVIAAACIKQISGLGKHGYLEGVKELI